MRLNQWLVRAGVAPARRKADELIESGRVLVNGDVPERGYRVAEGDEVTFDGTPQQVKAVTQSVLVLHKPAGYVSSHRAQGGDKTLFSLIPEEYADWKLIGRLDKDSEGLTLLSDDGDLVQELSHPSSGHAKHYRVWLDKKLTQGDLWQLESGVELDEGMSRFTRIIQENDAVDVWLMTGWNRQVRRTFEALGYRVRRLQRLELGAYQLGDLASGRWRLEERV